MFRFPILFQPSLIARKSLFNFDRPHELRKHQRQSTSAAFDEIAQFAVPPTVGARIFPIEESYIRKLELERFREQRLISQCEYHLALLKLDVKVVFRKILRH